MNTPPDLRCLRVDIHQHSGGFWVWQVSAGKNLLCISSKSYGSKAACCKGFYKVQDYLGSARVFIDNKEVM